MPNSFRLHAELCALHAIDHLNFIFILFIYFYFKEREGEERERNIDVRDMDGLLLLCALTPPLGLNLHPRQVP